MSRSTPTPRTAKTSRPWHWPPTVTSWSCGRAKVRTDPIPRTRASRANGSPQTDPASATSSRSTPTPRVPRISLLWRSRQTAILSSFGGATARAGRTPRATASRASGSPQTDPPWATSFQINTYTTDRQFSASVAMATDGDFVVVWRSYSEPPFSRIPARGAEPGTVYGQRFRLGRIHRR